MSVRGEGTAGSVRGRPAGEQPAGRAAHVRAASTAMPAAQPAGGREVDVLVACADEDARFIVGAALRHDGWRVQEIADAAAVPGAVRAGRPVLVVTSYPNASADGCTITERLRDVDETARLPILNVTSRAFPADLARAEAAGVTESLVMPVPPTEVVAAVRRLVGAPGLVRRTPRERPRGPTEDPA